MSSPAMHRVYLGLGSNLGQRRRTLGRACQMISELIGPIGRQSAFFVTAPWGFHSRRSFVNAVVMAETALTPHQVLARTQLIERQLGKLTAHATQRQNGETVYHDRPIDIDILLYDQLHLNTPDLIIPHPLMLQRPFVMEPLRQIIDEASLAACL